MLSCVLILCIDLSLVRGVFGAMATGWLRGTVKEVVSGDTVVIMGPSRGGPPPEKRLTLASLIAPRMVGLLLADEVFWVRGNWHRLLEVCRHAG